MAGKQQALDTYVQPQTIVFNAQVHFSTNLMLFSLLLSWTFPGLITFDAPTALPTDTTVTTSPHVLQARLLQRSATMQEDANKRVKTAH